MTECAQHEGLSVFGQMLMERAEIAEPAELVERMQEAGNWEVSREDLVALMHGESREISPAFWVYAGVVPIIAL